MISVKDLKKEKAVKDYAFKKLGVADSRFIDSVCRLSCIQCRKKWESLFLQGEQGNYIYYLVDGLVKLYRINDDGREVILKFIRPGEAFGHGVLGGAYPVCATALDKSELLAIDVARFKEEIFRDRVLLEKVFRIFNKEIQHLTSIISSMSLSDSRKQLENFLRSLSDETESKTVILPMPKCELALFLGTTPENLSRILRQMIDEGYISVCGRSITLLIEN